MWIFKSFTNFLLPYIIMAESYFNIVLNPVGRRVISLILLCIIISIIGVFAKNYFGKKLINLFDNIIKKIPLISTIYVSSKQVIHAFHNTNTDNFRKVLLIEYPKKGLYAIAFLTNTTLTYFNKHLREETLSVFLPTAPNPTSGFILIVPKKDVIELDMTVEEGFKFVLSIGMVAPDRLSGNSDKVRFK
ncbi:MAG: DUF502 domain-containing protein [Deferribacterota bacterium]|nr:DUF502 domain-containing protein [Deferribacterota bacterium]